jgi:hypothetical protein
MQGSPVSPQLVTNRVPPTSNPIQDTAKNEEEPKVDVVAELAAWRKERKKAYEDEIAKHQSDRASNGNTNTGLPRPPSYLSASAGPRGYGYGYDTGATNSLRRQVLQQQNSNGNGVVVKGPVTSAGDMTDIDILSHHVEGHWKGEIKVVRNPAPQGRTGVVDMYGNYFEKGYLYP